MDSIDVPIWAITGAGLAVVLWGIAVRQQLNRIADKLLEGHRQLMAEHKVEADRLGKLVHMHEHPSQYGFATGDTDELEAAIRELTHYVRWWIRAQTGEEPPPPFGIKANE